MKRMNRKNALSGLAGAARCLLCGAFAAVIAVSAGSGAIKALAAEDNNYAGRTDWYVHFTQQEKMESNFTTGQMSDIGGVLSELQPGDTAEFTVSLQNQHQETTDWYMENDIIRSMEDYDNNRATNGGAYSYRLVYYDDANKNGRVLYDSEAVGGENAPTDALVGLNEATQNLENFFFLGTLKNSQEGKVTLEVGIDGEAQGNDYQNTMAQLRMRFAVEMVPTYESKVEEGKDDSPSKKQEVTPTTPPGVVKTGDEVNMTPYFIAAFISGLLLLVVCIMRVRDEKKRGAGASRKGGA